MKSFYEFYLQIQREQAAQPAPAAGATPASPTAGAKPAAPATSGGGAGVTAPEPPGAKALTDIQNIMNGNDFKKLDKNTQERIKAAMTPAAPAKPAAPAPAAPAAPAAGTKPAAAPAPSAAPAPAQK